MPSTLTGFSKLAICALAIGTFGASAALAQGMMNSQSSSGDVVYETNRGSTLSPRSEFSGLPGVDLSDGAGKVRVRGPGGLQNNVGAIGMAAPSTSSANPLPLQNDTATTGGTFAVGR